jgi:hypothetical protein
MSNLISHWPTLIAPTVLRNDLPRMTGDEVDLLWILEMAFLSEIPTMFGLYF